MSDSLVVGLLQAELKWRDPERNRAHLADLLAGGHRQAHVIVMPETFTTGFLGDSDLEEEGMDGPTVAWMKDLAARHGCAVTGSAVIGANGGRANRLLWVEPGGSVKHYDKKHLFSHAGEDRRYVAGARNTVIDYRGWRIRPQVCYDLRFPAWCRYRGDYDMLLFVANWPEPRIGAWSTLLEARAIENQCAVVAVNRVGEDGKGQSYPGQSVIHGPLGETLVRLDDQECYAEQSVELQAVRSVRRELPFHADADPFEFTG